MGVWGGCFKSGIDCIHFSTSLHIHFYLQFLIPVFSGVRVNSLNEQIDLLPNSDC